jgi:hypothetical protein
MRSSITKSVVLTLSIVAALTLAAPAAHAGARTTNAKTRTVVAQDRFQERFKDVDPLNPTDPIQRVVRLVKKIVVVVTELPVIPIP